MALLLVPMPGGDYVTACSLDLRLVDRPARPGSQTFILRIARNGNFNQRDNQKPKDLAGKIIQFIQAGRLHSRNFTERI